MSWLRNLQGQLTELASEVLNEANDVLNEAAEEVADPESELQVERRKCAETEKQLAIEQAKSAAAEERASAAEQQLYATHSEMDDIGTKYAAMISGRDEQIKKMQVELEQLRSGWAHSAHPDHAHSDHEEEALKQQVADLKKELAHWKKQVKQNKETSSSGVPQSEVDAQLDELRRQKHDELLALMEQHEENIHELRDSYEEKISALQALAPTSSSESGSDLLDAVMMEKEELLEEKRRLEKMVRERQNQISESPVVVDLDDTQRMAAVEQRAEKEKTELEQRVREMEEKLEEEQGRREAVVRENEELALAYNDLNEEFEAYKRENRETTGNTADLHHRIDSLKASLIEYEERYEMCKRENAETVRQLERLSGDFERLRNGFAEARCRTANVDEHLTDEVEKLRAALQESRNDREKLCADVDRFRDVVGEIDVELRALRESNARLFEENARLGVDMDRFRGDDLADAASMLARSEAGIAEFRADFEQLQAMHAEREAEWNAERAELLSQLRAAGVSGSEEEEGEKEGGWNEWRDETEQTVRVRQQPLQAASGGWEEEKAELVARLERAEWERNTLIDEHRLTMTRLEVMKSVEERLIEAENSLHDMHVKEEEGDGVSSVASLIDQLREALKANTELTEEYDRLRQDKEDVEKEIQVRQNCIDEMIVQTNTLQQQHQHMVESLAAVRQQLADKEKVILEQQQQIYHVEERMREGGPGEGGGGEGETSGAADVAEMRAKLRSAEEMVNSLEKENIELTEKLSEAAACASQSQMLSADLEYSQEALTAVNEQMTTLREERDALKEQVHNMQDAATVAAEERALVDDRLVDVQTRMEEVEQQKEQLEQQLEQARREREEREGSTEVSDELDAAKIALEQARIQAAKQMSVEQDLRNKLDEEREKARGGLEETERRYEDMMIDMTNQYAEARAAADSATVELETLREKVRDLEKATPTQAPPTDLLAEKARLEETVQLMGQKINELETALAEQATVQQSAPLAAAPSDEETEQLREEKAGWEAEREQLRQLLTEKHEESVGFWQRLETTMGELAAVRQEMADKEERERRENSSSSLAAEKQSAELRRLREHLVLVEEASTREAVEAERRETGLREQIRLLEQRTTAAADTVAVSSQQYAAELSELRGQLECSEAAASEWRERFEAERKAAAEGAAALSSLQGVVRELAADHERDAATAGQRMLQMQALCDAQERAAEGVRADLARAEEERSVAEDAAEEARQQAERAARCVEELEQQLDEARAPHLRARADEYRVDDATLRQLFLSYLLAPSDKQPDIALLLASILEYSAEDVEKVRQAVRAAPHQRSTHAGPSLTQQFIRFLEVESESARTAARLPVDGASAAPMLVDPLSQPAAPHDSSLHTLLRPPTQPSPGPAPPS